MDVDGTYEDSISMEQVGFIGSHMVRRLKKEGYWVRGVDLKYPEFSETEADEFVIGDLTDDALALNVCNRSFDEIYQFAADMGGAGYLFTGENDANIMHIPFRLI